MSEKELSLSRMYLSKNCSCFSSLPSIRPYWCLFTEQFKMFVTSRKSIYRYTENASHIFRFYYYCFFFSSVVIANTHIVSAFNRIFTGEMLLVRSALQSDHLLCTSPEVKIRSEWETNVTKDPRRWLTPVAGETMHRRNDLEIPSASSIFVKQSESGVLKDGELKIFWKFVLVWDNFL